MAGPAGGVARRRGPPAVRARAGLLCAARARANKARDIYIILYYIILYYIIYLILCYTANKANKAPLCARSAAPQVRVPRMGVRRAQSAAFRAPRKAQKLSSPSPVGGKERLQRERLHAASRERALAVHVSAFARATPPRSKLTDHRP